MRFFCAIALISCALVFSGCTVAPVMTLNPNESSAGRGAHGRVHGGQNPISGAQVYLYAANTTGYAGPGIAASSSNASVSLLKSSVLTQVPAGGKDSSNNYM